MSSPPLALDREPDHAPAPVPARLDFTRAGVGRGFLRTLPLGVGSLIFGMAFGVLAGGIPLLRDGWAVGMSAAVFSGAAQMASVDLIATRAGAITIWTTTLLVSVRYVLLGLTTRAWFAGQPSRVRLFLPFVMSDEVWGLSHREFVTATTTATTAATTHEDGQRGDLGFFLGSGLAMVGCWTVGTAAGLAIGGGMPDPATFGIDFIATASFIALLAGMTAGHRGLSPSLIAAALAAIAAERWLPGQWSIPIGAIAGLMTQGLTARDGRDRGGR